MKAMFFAFRQLPDKNKQIFVYRYKSWSKMIGYNHLSSEELENIKNQMDSLFNERSHEEKTKQTTFV